ncbi:MAG: DNA polymerase III subunit beta [Hyphomicrobiaceae bacterium]|nr:DNA polymerase III subunit beta [Hyphomicrobiaceae bacterium]
MKIIVQTAALQEALALAGTIVVPRTPKPVLQCVKLVAGEKALTVLATDLEAALRYKVTAVKVEQDGEALISAERLSGIVRESDDEESLTIETDKEACHVRGAGSHFKIFGYDPGEYPAVAEFTEEADFQIAAAPLAKMITKTLFATAKAHSHYAISGVLWEASGKKVQLVATDGHRLAQAIGTASKPAAKGVTAIVPAKLMSLIQRIASDGEEKLDVKIQENQILLRTSRAVLVSSLVQGNFPKYTDVIPKEITQKATIKTAQFEHRIRQAALLTNEESKGIRLKFQADQVTLSSRAPETGEAEVTCPVKYEGEPMEIAFNPVFLTDALRVAETDEITFGMNATNKPALMKAGSDFLYVIMPVDLG